MGESYLSDSDKVQWHVHDIYEGAGQDVRHAHQAGNGPHSHDWREAKPITEERDGFFIEAERLRDQDPASE